MTEPLARKDGEDPYAIHSDLQEIMQTLVGIIRTQDDLDEALVRLAALRERQSRVAVWGSPKFNPGWNLALDLEAMLAMSEAVTRAAAMRRESRGGHTRDDFPKPDPEWATKNVVVRRRDGDLDLTTEPIPVMPDDLRELVGEQAKPAAETTAMEATVPAGRAVGSGERP
jgi:succinate dehydrogenase / fumarate reductase flavoprotein subunit